jgi:hypothetical protein
MAILFADRGKYTEPFDRELLAERGPATTDAYIPPRIFVDADTWVIQPSKPGMLRGPASSLRRPA